MKTLKRLLVVMFVGLFVFISCTSDVPQDITPATRGTLVIDVGTYDGADSYEVTVGNNPVKVVDGKASIDLDFASYDVYITAKKNGKVLADFYKSIDFEKAGVYKARLEAIDATRYYSMCQINMPSEGEQTLPSLTETIIALKPDKTYEKIVVGVAVEPSVLGPIMSPTSLVSGGAGSIPLDAMIPVCMKHVGTYAINADKVTLTESGGTAISYTIDGNKMTSATESFYAVSGEAGASLSGDYWSLPQIVLSKDVLNQLLSLIPPEVVQQFNPDMKTLVSLNQDLLVNAGFRLLKGNIEMYLDISVAADCFDGKMVMEKPIKAGMKASFPIQYSDMRNQVILNIGDMPIDIRLRRLPGGSMMVFEVVIKTQDPNYGNINMEIPFGRNDSSREIVGNSFGTTKYLDLEYNLRQMQTFSEQANIKSDFEMIATPVHDTKIGGNKTEKIVLGNWKCADVRAEKLNFRADYFDTFINGYGMHYSTVCSGNEKVYIFTDKTEKTEIKVKNVEYTYSADNAYIDKITAYLSIKQGNQTPTEWKQYTFTREPFTEADVYKAINRQVDYLKGIEAQMSYTNDGKIYVDDNRTDRFLFPIKYSVDSDSFYFYITLNDLLDNAHGGIPGMGMINPGLNFTSYLQLPYNSADDMIVFFSNSDKSEPKNYGLKLADKPWPEKSYM